MRIWNGLDAIPEGTPPFVATIGNYDGVHLGHRTILRRIVDRAALRDARSLLITFDPHPLSVVAPDRRPRLLQTRGQKLDRLRETGLDDVWIVPFDTEIAALDGRAFFHEILEPRARFLEIHVGENFRFGRGREGDVALLRSLGATDGFDVHGVEPLVVDGAPVSSSRVRRAIAEGDVDGAQRLLGRPYEIAGRVVRGAGRGAGLDFPTANLAPENGLLPARGVYVTECIAEATRWRAMTNVGTRPTFDDGEVAVESHLLGFEGDLVGEELTVRFLARLRDEVRFDGPAQLVDQLARDRAATEAFFENAAFPAT